MELNDYQTVGNIVLNKISNIKVLPIVKQKQDNFRFV
jgi:hypothetical protein